MGSLSLLFQQNDPGAGIMCRYGSTSACRPKADNYNICLLLAGNRPHCAPAPLLKI
jgi:hypothetical protein